MNPLRQMFEDFGEAQKTVGKTEVALAEVDLEGVRLEAFENGFKAGWDDALKAQSDDRTRISSALAQHLQDLSFTYHEASNHMLDAISPLLKEMVNALLPGIARATIGMHLVDKLHEMAKDIGSVEVEIAVSAANLDGITDLLSQDFGFPVSVVEDDTLADEQADIRFGQVEKQIDLGDLLASVSEAVEGFAHDNRRKLANG
ncbi:ABC transporter ATP-binding protein [Tropicibacter sp. S64]|uniref:ABC transporter ATP-binding protein n=1 Tax=Tropicibacter sp. S64 TaxID=3415122 RepID=UPI003C7BC722